MTQSRYYIRSSADPRQCLTLDATGSNAVMAECSDHTLWYWTPSVGALEHVDSSNYLGLPNNECAPPARALEGVTIEGSVIFGQADVLGWQLGTSSGHLTKPRACPKNCVTRTTQGDEVTLTACDDDTTAGDNRNQWRLDRVAPKKAPWWVVLTAGALVVGLIIVFLLYRRHPLPKK